jgi:hypothetical protein
MPLLAAPVRPGVVSVALSPPQLAAAHHAGSAACRERHRDRAMTVDDVLDLRRLVALCDALGAAAATGLADTLELTAASLGLLHDALSEWSEAREEQGWMRADDHDAHRVLQPLLWELGELRADVVRAALAPAAACA